MAAGPGRMGLAAAEHRHSNDGVRARWRLAAGGGLALVCSAAMTGVFLAYGRIEAFSPFTTVTVASAAALIVMLPIEAAAGVMLPQRGDTKGVVAVSLLDMVAFLAGTAALALGPVSVASVLQAQTATISTALGLLLLHERAAWWQTVGVLATIAGVSVLAWAM